MKFSERWLREWVATDVTAATLCEQLTNAGLEVEGTSAAAPAFDGVVVGEVVAARTHPDAERLSVCEVSDGAGTFQVVCGAPNARPGLRAPFARVGATLPGGPIGLANLRGVESAGMLCSAAELGLGDATDGLLELPAGFALGADLREALALDDRCIELDLTPNRGDCLSLRGIAREVAALNGVAVTPPTCHPVPATIEDRLAIDLDAPAGCPRYLGRVIRGVDLARQTPLWMSERLRRSGLRSIDVAVDVTNYVLLELGQPLHAFDLGRLRRGIVVRMAHTGERLKLLDGREVALDEETLTIADGAGAVAMAGVMGGERSAVTSATQDIFLECAYFAPLAIGGTARRYGLQTDASQRYERGVDHALQAAAIERATRLMLDVAGGAAGPVVEAKSATHLPRPAQVTLRRRRLDALVGEAIPEGEVDRIFERLEFSPRRVGAGEARAWQITPPSHRFDIAIEEDLVEEVCRVYGYNRIGARASAWAMPLRQVTRGRAPAAALADALAALGYREAITYTFVDPTLADLLDPHKVAPQLANPMSQDRSVLRPSLLPGLVGALQANLARQQSRVRLFEMGQCFAAGEADDPQRWVSQWVGGIAFGPRWPESWATAPPQGLDFFDVKGDVERLIEIGGHPASFEAADDPALHPGQSAQVLMAGKAIGRVGRLHPELERKLQLNAPAFVFELLTEALLDVSARRHQPVTRFPRVRRDLSLVVAAAVPAAAVQAAAQEVLGDALAECVLFDVYRGEGIDLGEKSLGLELTFESASRTLADDEVNRSIDALLACLKKDFGARLR